MIDMDGNLELIGGEMLDWSDRRPDERPPAGGAVLAHLLGLITSLVPAGGRVLVAGPHDEALVDALAGHVAVTCLLRSEMDATAVAARGVTVLCGSLSKVTDVDHYDAVVALDGLDRLCSVEGPQYDWAESLHALRRALRPGGALLISVENELGVHRLVDRSAVTAAHTDGAWRPVGEFDATKPGNPERIAAQLTTEGLSVGWLAASWPLPQAPTLVATPAALRDGPVGALAGVAAGVAGVAYANVSVLSDPRRLTAAAVRAGLGPEFAPSWLVLAHRAAEPVIAPLLPAVLVGDGPVVEITLEGETWVRHVAGGETAATPERDPSRLDGPLPTGRLLEELLLGACLRHDLPALRRLLTGWTSWLGTLGDERAYATVDNVLLDGDTYRLLDPSRRTAEPVDVPDAAAPALRRFGQALIDGGYAHPWPAAVDVESLTAVLAGAAGLELDPDAPVVDTAPPVADSLREHEEVVRNLRVQLAEATKRAEWSEKEVAKRDSELRKAKVKIDAFSGSLGYRVAKFGAKGARKVLRAARKTKR
jgi:hypothetical protein